MSQYADALPTTSQSKPLDLDTSEKLCFENSLPLALIAAVDIFNLLRDDLSNYRQYSDIEHHFTRKSKIEATLGKADDTSSAGKVKRSSGIFEMLFLLGHFPHSAPHQLGSDQD